MSWLTTLVRSLGNAGAQANARLVLESRQREDWIIESLARRLEVTGAPALLPAQPARVA